MSRNAVKSGEGYVELKLRNRIAEGAAGVQRDLDNLSKKAMALGASIAASSGALLAMPLREASKMQETMGKFGIVFGDASKDVQKWSDITAAAVGVSRQSMANMLASMQDLLVPMGVLPDEATEMSKTLSTLAVDLASFNNMHSAEVFDNLMSAITGEGQVMKKYGVILTETATKQELLNMGMDPSTADNAAKAQARLNIILRGTTAAQGDAIRTASSFANQMNILWSSVLDASGAIGGAFLDDTAALVRVARDAVMGIADFANNNKDLVRVAGLATMALGGLGVALIGVGVAAKVAAITIGAVGTAAHVAAAVASLAWAGVSATFFVLTLKSRLTAAIVSATWKVASKAVAVAWTAATSVISIAMQGLTAVVSAAAVAAPWLAGAALIASAYFGLDVVLAALAAGASAAWAAAAGFVGTTWTALAGVFAAVGAAGSASAAFVSAAWTAFGAVSSIIAAKMAAEATIVGTVMSGAALGAGVAFTGLKAVLMSTTFQTGLLVVGGIALGVSFGTGAAIAISAVSALWTAITGPLLPFIAVAGVATAVVAAMAAVVGVAAIKAIDFGSAFGKAKSMLGGIVTTITDVFDVLKVALGGGDYGAAAEVLWAGVQVAFWRGARGTLNAFKWLWKEAMTTSGQFFVELLKMADTAMSALAKAVANPVGAGVEIGAAIAELADTSLSFDVDANTIEAEKKLLALYAQLRKNAAAAGGGGAPGTGGAPGGGGGPGDEDAFKDKIRAIGIEIIALEKGAQAADRMRLADEGLNAVQIRQIEILKQKKKALEDAQAFANKTREIELEIVALQNGEKAAERMRLADEGLNSAQIEQIELLKQKRKALEDVKAAQEKEQEARLKAIGKSADRLREDGMSPGEVFQRTMQQIDSDQQGGKLSEESADGARERAKDELDAGLQRLRAEGRALAEAIRTPSQVLADKLARIDQLQAAGVITTKQADKARFMERGDFAEEQKAREEKVEREDKALAREQRMVGPSGSFSAFGASLIGGPALRYEQEQLKLTKGVLQNTKEIAKQAGKPRRGVFG